MTASRANVKRIAAKQSFVTVRVWPRAGAEQLLSRPVQPDNVAGSCLEAAVRSSKELSSASITDHPIGPQRQRLRDRQVEYLGRCEVGPYLKRDQTVPES
jgi:hypothetical protein